MDSWRVPGRFRWAAMGWLSLIVALPRLWTTVDYYRKGKFGIVEAFQIVLPQADQEATAALVESHDRVVTGAVEAHSSLARH